MARGSFLSIPCVEIVHDDVNKPHAVFHVQISTEQGEITVPKRFSDFRSFDKHWRKLYPMIPVRFPPRVFFGNRSRQVTNERRVQLKVYLHALCSLDESRQLVAQFLGVSTSDLCRRGTQISNEEGLAAALPHPISTFSSSAASLY